MTGWTFLEPEKNGAKPVSASGAAIILQKIAMSAGAPRAGARIETLWSPLQSLSARSPPLCDGEPAALPLPEGGLSDKQRQEVLRLMGGS